MAQKSLILCDTNILIGLFRKDAAIKAALDKIGADNIAISVITKAELLVGTKKINYTRVLEIIDTFELIQLDTEASLIFERLISNKKTFNSEKHIPDLLIAAIALANNLPLYTNNRKHFESILKLSLYEPR